MAKGRKTGGRNFVKGVVTNPTGPKPLPTDIKESRKLTQVEFERLVNKYLYGDKNELQKATADPKTPLIELMIGSILHKGIIQGDERRLEFLLSRLIGKVVQPIEHSGPEAPKVVVYIPENNRVDKLD